MRRLYATAALLATLALMAPSGFEASFAGANDAPEKTVPQGQDPPGADNGQQQSPLAEHKEVIPPPPTGDEPKHRRLGANLCHHHSAVEQVGGPDT
jgi:hypothetical protein